MVDYIKKNISNLKPSATLAINEKIKQRAKIKKQPLTEQDIKRAADIISEMATEADDMMKEELSEEDYNTFFPSKKTIH